MTVVDTHCHVISQDLTRYPRAPLGGTPSVWAKERPISSEEFLVQMDQAGVDRAVLVQASTNYGYDNSYVLDSAARWPDRFVAVGTFEPLAPHAGARLEEAASQGLVGVRLFTTDGAPGSAQGLWFASDEAEEFWESASATGMPVCLQLRLGPETSTALEGLLGRHPDVTLLLDHAGYPDVSGPLDEAVQQVAPFARFRNVHLKLTHRTLEGLHAGGQAAVDFLEPLVRTFGAERIAWGSNVPAATQTLPELVALAEQVLAPLPAQQREAIFHGTAEHLYPGLVRA